MVVKTLGAEEREGDRFEARAEALRDRRILLGVRQAALYQLLDLLPASASCSPRRRRVAGRPRPDHDGHVRRIPQPHPTRHVAPPSRRLGARARCPAPWPAGSGSRACSTSRGHRRRRTATPTPLRDGARGAGLGLTYEDGHGGARRRDVRPRPGITAALVGPTGGGKSTLLQVLSGLLEPTTGDVSAARTHRARVSGALRVRRLGPFQHHVGRRRRRRHRARRGRGRPSRRVHRQAARGIRVGHRRAGGDAVRGPASASGPRPRPRPAAGAVVARRRHLGVDPATEAAILTGLAGAFAGTTTLVVANRPSTIALADIVLFLADGRLEAYGTHAELLRSSPGYADLVEAYERERTGALVPDRSAASCPRAPAARMNGIGRAAVSPGISRGDDVDPVRAAPRVGREPRSAQRRAASRSRWPCSAPPASRRIPILDATDSRPRSGRREDATTRADAARRRRPATRRAGHDWRGVADPAPPGASG